MTQRLYTTQEFRLITRIPQRTHDRWVAKGYLPPVERGVGRGKPHKFDEACGIWAMGLNEIFNLWPRAKSDCALYLDFESSDSHRPPPSEGPLSLEHGERILSYIRDQERTDERSPHPFSLIVMILNSNKGHFLNPSSERSVEIRIGPTFSVLDLMDRYLANPLHPFSTTQRVEEIKSVTGISLARLSRKFRFERDRLNL